MRRNELLFDAIGSIEDSLLDRTEEKGGRTTQALCASLVSLCLLFVMGMLFAHRWSHRVVTSHDGLFEQDSPGKAR